MTNRPKLIAIVGPTASGKTNLARFLATRFNGELISADSRQVYRGLDIGTGKEGVWRTGPAGDSPLRYLGDIPQWLIDVADPNDRFTAVDFQTQATQIIENILSRGKLPIIVGGTMMYVTALLEGYNFQPSSGRDAKNSRHAEQTTWQKNPPAWDALVLMIELQRDDLYARIDDRLMRRLDDGMVTEAKQLIALGVSPDRLREIGLEYRFMADLLEEKITDAQFKAQLKQAIHQYARRQIAWWRHHGVVSKIHNQTEAEQLVTDFLT